MFRALLFILLLAQPLVADKPNVIVFMADDMGYADAGFTGAKDIQTPHLDQLAKSGVVFRKGYVNHPFCGPSRAAFLSGRYQHRFGFETNPAYDPSNPHQGIDSGEILFPKRMQKVGYHTGIIGKWHLGAAPPFHPNKRGFDYFYGFLGGGHDYFRIDLRQPVKEAYLQALERNGQPASFDGYLTTALSQDAAQFVDRNKDKPFFLFVAYNAPHAPLQAPKELIEKYADIEDRKRRIYAAMVDSMDAGIGLVIDALERNDLRDNTLVFFLSDNGGPVVRPGRGDGNGSSNKPFRGGKGDFFEGGVHVPFIASWPAKIPANSTFDHPVIALDIARTAVALARGDAAEAPAMEGTNLIPHLVGENDKPPHEFLYWRGGNGRGWSILRHDGYKQLSQPNPKSPGLHFLPDDIGEEKSLSSDKPKLAASLRKQWESWDGENVPNRMMPYKQYHKDRDKFFEKTFPPGADYTPEPIPTMR
ncbi:MAG: sulfatase-like hydrolase/transferase [Verrucomicrobiota bacterium]